MILNECARIPAGGGGGALVGGASLDPVEFGKICINYIHQMETQE